MSENHEEIEAFTQKEETERVETVIDENEVEILEHFGIDPNPYADMRASFREKVDFRFTDNIRACMIFW